MFCVCTEQVWGYLGQVHEEAVRVGEQARNRQVIPSCPILTLCIITGGYSRCGPYFSQTAFYLCCLKNAEKFKVHFKLSPIFFKYRTSILWTKFCLKGETLTKVRNRRKYKTAAQSAPPPLLEWLISATSRTSITSWDVVLLFSPYCPPLFSLL